MINWWEYKDYNEKKKLLKILFMSQSNSSVAFNIKYKKKKKFFNTSFKVYYKRIKTIKGSR